MSTPEAELIEAFETHSAAGMRAAFAKGVDARALYRGQRFTTHLTTMYTRSAGFVACLRELLARGAEVDDPLVLPVLLDDGEALAEALRAEPGLLEHRTTMASTFTSLRGASLLHVAAEFGHVNAARALLSAGADVDARAATDEYGLDGQTPLFHTVNSHGNHALPVLELLLEAGARTDVRLAGLVWGRGFEWETTLFDVTPFSYAQCGLLPQIHRDERGIDQVLRRLLVAAGRSVPPLENVPNRYLRPKS